MGKSKKNAKPPADLSRFEGNRWNLPRCFIIHAWSPSGIKHVIQHIRTALEGNFHVDVDLDFGADESIREKALAAIEEASLVICILDDLAPNVTFEYGCAKALKKPCIRMVRNGAVVNVLKYFPKDKQPLGVQNPLLDCNTHFSDVRDLVHCPYDHEDPEAAKKLLMQEFAKIGSSGKSLARHIIETWVALMKEGFGKAGDFEPLFDYILRTKTIELGKPLFATQRQKKFSELLVKGFKSKTSRNKAVDAPKSEELPDATVEAISDLPPEAQLSVIRKLTRTYPNDERLLFAECLCLIKISERLAYRDESKNNEAKSLCESFLKKFPDAYAGYYNFGLLLSHLKRLDEAEQYFREALRINPGLEVAHNNYANLLKLLQRPEEAERHYREAIQINPENAAAHYNYANLVSELQRLEEAERHYQEAVRIRPEYADAHYNFAVLLQKLERWDEAERHYQEAVRIDPEDLYIQFGYAVLLQKLERWDEAEQHYLEVLRISPEDADTHYNYAILLQKLERWDKAEWHYREALRISAKEPHFHGGFALFLEAQGRNDEARHHFEEAERLELGTE
ncbi:MAG: transrane and repeat-containing protein 1-like [Pedosphaera sp.]|nr:transrane and repeat-containing protein 1-like [Pedosphaera sp.]